MKKWNNPELMILGVESTKQIECDFPTTYDPNSPIQHHYCHLNPSHNHSSSQHNGDAATGRKHWVSENCDEHEYCCCHGLS